MLLRSLLFLGLLILHLSSKGSDFFVTSNADSGPGTLREAISLAASNGSADLDRILFNLPDLSVAGRTIILESVLPALSSQLEIDGTSQPGTAFGVSDTKIWIQYRFSVGMPVSLFFMEKCTNVGIFGLKMDNQVDWTAYYEETRCIDIQQSSNIRIGAPGKGNLIINWIHAIYVNTYYGGQPYRSSNIFIKSNMLGMEEDGETAAMNDHLMEINNIDNIEVGGLDPSEGNVMATAYRRIMITRTNGEILIANNKIGTNYPGTAVLSMPYGESNRVFDNIHIGNSIWYNEESYTTNVRVLNNLSTGYCGAGVSIIGVGNKFYVQGNRIGTDVTGVQRFTQGMDYGVYIENCRNGIIGVENDEVTEKNIIAFGKWISSAPNGFGGMGISIANTEGVVISRNSIFCNENKGITIDTNGAYKAPLITVNAIAANSVSGTAPPNSKIEVFRDDNCPNCEGKTYLETIYADATGRWERNNASSKDLVFTATDPVTHTTSEFSSPYMQQVGWAVIPASCGKANGAITGWIIRSGTEWHWEDEFGNIVGRDTSLIDVPSGNYRLVVSIGGACSRSTDLIYVPGEDLPDDIDVGITNASCGSNNGSAEITTGFTDLSIEWIDEAGTVLSDQLICYNLLPGAYYVKLSGIVNKDCNKTYGPFYVGNENGPSIDISKVIVEPARCTGGRGSIRGLQLLNGSGNGYLAWKNEAGEVLGNELELLQQPAGRYRFYYKEFGGCDTLKSAFITVSSEGEIGLDETEVQVSPATCSGLGGSISGITATGAETFTWKKLTGETVSGSSIEMNNQVAGSYQLTAENRFGCSEISGIYEIRQAAFDAPSIAAITIQHVYCGNDNGSIEVRLAGADPSDFSFRWTLKGSTVQIGDAVFVSGLKQGAYELYATDKNQCEGKLLEENLVEIPAAIISSPPVLQEETCSQQNGSINGLQLTGLQGPATYSWYDARGQLVGDNQNIDQLTAGDYQLKVLDAGFCEIVSPVFRIENRNSVLEIPHYKDQVIPIRTAATLKLENTGIASYDLFADASGSQLIETNTTGNFTTPTLDINTAYYIQKRINDCRSPLVKVSVTVVEESFIRVPTAFSPNGDGKNDLLHLKVIGIVDLAYFNVYDRFGTLVFSSTDPAIGWDGMVGGKPAGSGNFVWTAGGKDFFGKSFKDKGTVLLLR